MKKFMKALAMILALILALSLIACSGEALNEGIANEGGFDVSPGNPNYGISGDQNNSSIADDSYIDNNKGDMSPNTPAEPEMDEENAPDYGMVEGGNTPEAGTGDGVPDDQETAEENQGNSGEIPPKTSLITTPFIKAEDVRFSTFSADVDTASYTYFRKLVGYGYGLDALRAGSSNFRVEEFINYFRYDVKGPEEDELFGVTTSLIPCPWDEGTMLFRATLQAESVKTDAPNNLVFLIDVSGSMSSSDKLPLLKKAFSHLVGNLKPTDTVSIVTYSGREAVVLDGCLGSKPSEIMSAINSLTANGSTNGEAGLTMAYQIAEKYMKEGGNNRIIMASDGDLNVGISSASELTKYIENKRDQGIYLSVLGFGTGNYRDANMEALADNGNGVYYYIDGESEAEKVFGTDLLGTLYTVANDVKLQIEFDPAYVEEYRLIGYDNRILDKEDFEDDTKDAGEVGAGHQVTVCYEIKLTGTALGTSSIIPKILTLRVRYKNPGEPLSRLNEYAVSDAVSQSDSDMRFIASVIELASLISNREYNGDVTLESIISELNGLDLTDTYKIEFRELVKALAQNK